MSRSLFLLLVLLASALPAAAQQDASTARRASWFADRRDFSVGDVITIEIEEASSASGRSRAREGRDRKLNVGAGGQVGASIDIPAVSAATGVARAQTDDQEVTRRNHLVGMVAARVVEIGDGGILRVEGERQVTVDGNIETMRLTGWLRPEDISPSATASSTRLADANISYRGKSPLLRRGLIGRFLELIWP